MVHHDVLRAVTRFDEFMAILLRAVVLLGLIVTFSCGSDARPAGVASPATPATAATMTPVLAPGTLPAHGTILIGDLHGTREIPAFVGALVTELVAREPVVLGLEIQNGEVPSLDGFLASDGGPVAREAALRDPWWHAARQDGRRSVAMFELIDTVRRLRARGAWINIVCFDALGSDAETRDAAMAGKLVAARQASPEAALVVYVGNSHARRAEARERPRYAWMAMHMAKAGVALVTLDPRYGAGSLWTCEGRTSTDCRAHYTVGDSTVTPGVHLEPARDGAYDGWFGVASVTASPPVAFPELAVGLDAKLTALRDSPEAHRSRARGAVRDKDYPRCIAELLRVEAPSGVDAYTLACCYALAGNRDAAFDQLRAARARGYRDLDGMKADTDLESLHSDPRWSAVMAP
jgi:hypothetical protein